LNARTPASVDRGEDEEARETVDADPAEHHDPAEVGEGDQDVESAKFVGEIVGEKAADETGADDL
jgi:hypothetical protein